MSTASAIELIIDPPPKDLGGFEIRRVLPAPKRRMVGPFIFLDHMGPADFPPGEGIQVRPHPHIGLATVTYLFAGEIMHRDSLGFVQPIQAGAVNLMTAGRGIVHSERAGDDLNQLSHLHGMQSWMALPEADEEIEPSFIHYPASELPVLSVDGVGITVIIGAYGGQTSPVKSYSPMLYLECQFAADTTLELPADYEERAVYVVAGSIKVDGEAVASGLMAVLRPGQTVQLSAAETSRVMVIGGAPLGHRHIWWNFVSSSRERMEQAKADWKNGAFNKVPGDDEFIPLPED